MRNIFLYIANAIVRIITSSITYFFLDKNNNKRIFKEINKMHEENNLMDTPEIEFVFRPFDLVKIDCNNDKYGNIVPAARSGHRIVCNEGNMFCFGGFNPDYQRQGRQFLFHELWKFNKYREQWSLLLDSQSVMPRELASNAITLEGDVLMVSMCFNSFTNILNILFIDFWWHWFSFWRKKFKQIILLLFE